MHSSPPVGGCSLRRSGRRAGHSRNQDSSRERPRNRPYILQRPPRRTAALSGPDQVYPVRGRAITSVCYSTLTTVPSLIGFGLETSGFPWLFRGSGRTGRDLRRSTATRSSSYRRRDCLRPRPARLLPIITSETDTTRCKNCGKQRYTFERCQHYGHVH